MTEAPIEPDTDAAIAFLQMWKPGGPWVLTAINPDRKGIETRTCTTLEECRAFIDKWQGKRNIYFTVNSVLRLLSKKASREDIKSMDWLHGDFDPRAGEDFADERERILKLLTTPNEHGKLPGGLPLPSVIIDSGGGFQAFWRLREPVPINGQAAEYEEAKRYNLFIENALGGDNCHNVDRIMRLPGTINLPDEKKKAKGRKPALAKLVEVRDV